MCDEIESPKRQSSAASVNSAWRGVFAESLYRVTQDVHPGFGIQREALDHVEELIIRLLLDMAVRRPHSIADIEQHISKTFPAPLNVWSIKEAQEVLVKSHRRHRDRSAIFPLQRVHLLLRESLGYKVDSQVTLFISSVLEYVAADILKLTGNYVKNIRRNEITLQDLKVAMRADNVLMDLFYHDDELPIISFNAEDMVASKIGSLSYEQTVKDLVHHETQFLREVDMIVLVFRRSLMEFAEHLELDAIFSNISDIHECTSKFLSFLEDTVEMYRDPDVPFIGNCFLEMAEGAEFEVYEKYMNDVLNPKCLEVLDNALRQPTVVQHLEAQGNGYYLAVKYLLPKLLLRPVYHCLKYFEFLPVLIKLASCDEDKYDLVQTESLLMPLKSRLEFKCASLSKAKSGNCFDLRFIPGESNRFTSMKLLELRKSVDGWDDKNIGCNCVMFILEGKLKKCVFQKLTNSILSSSDTQRPRAHKTTERFVFLFDGVIVFCKPSPSRRSVGPGSEYRLKEFYLTRKIEVLEHEDADDLKHMFEIRQRDTLNSTVLLAPNAEEKSTWMAALLMLQTRSMLERMLASCLEEQKRIPLLLPSVEQYRFAEPDSEENIVLEDYTSSSGIPVVRGATLTKLIERLTYHIYPDTKFVRTFLTTFRSFCTQSELLNLLIERFDIPDPLEGTGGSSLASSPVGTTMTPISFSLVDSLDSSCRLVDNDSLLRESVKRLRKEYIRPVRISVLKVIKQWIDRHWYDFDQDPDLLLNLEQFLKRIEDVHTMSKCSRSLQKFIDRKKQTRPEPKELQFSADPPPLECYLAVLPEEYDLMTLHPIEIARQITLLEFDLYRAVKPIELVGAAWTKKDKDKRSPQLLKLIQHSTKFTYWLEKCVVECGNINERVAVMNRILEIMCIFQELNNFTGLIEIYGVLESSAIHRLYHTWERLDQKLLRVFEEVKQVLSDAHHKLIRERLRSINPPCVPFFGMYLTNIIFLEEGNPIFLKMPLSSQSSEAESSTADLEKPTLISFAKCRKIADIIGEIQMYQDVAYCLIVEPTVRHFFESLNPLQGFASKNDLEAYLYSRSLEIEPKDCDKPPNFAPLRKYTLKSPGIKPQKVPQHARHKCPSAAPALLFTPLINYGRDRQNSAATLPLRRTPNTAPASPTSKEASVFAIVEINPGEQPRHVLDVTDPSLRCLPTSQSLRLERRVRKHSHPMSLINDTSSPPCSSLAPPIPPRQAKANSGQQQRLCGNNFGHQTSPVCPEEPNQQQSNVFLFRTLPRSGASCSPFNNSCFHFPQNEAKVESGDGGATTACCLAAPETSPVRPGSNVVTSTSLATVATSTLVPGTAVSMSPPQNVVDHPLHVQQQQQQQLHTVPPEIPPRCTSSRNACFATLPHPLPFVVETAKYENRDERSGTSPSANSSTSKDASSPKVATSGLTEVVANRSPPPLPPKGVMKMTAAPPRPPKCIALEQECPRGPPLPPKTYKQKTTVGSRAKTK
uniref:Ras-GEF domain-containing protein n=1 Tax=Trichuris muris TaxID=70415 RepID=A0A5S6QYQ6_TRIMR